MTESPNPYEPSQESQIALPERRSIARYYVLAGLCATSIIAYVGRTCLGVAEGEIREELNISIVSMGLVMGTFFWSYALAQIPAGWLGHVWGTRKALALYAFTWSLACVAMGMANDVSTLIAAQVFFGIAQAGLFPCAAAVISRWIPEKRRAIASGLLGGSQSLGGAVGSALTGPLLAGTFLAGLWWPTFGGGFYHLDGIWADWRTLYTVYAIPGILWAMWFFLWFRDRPSEHRGVNQAELALLPTIATAPAHTTKHRAGTPWKRVATSFDLWMVFGQQFCRAAGYIFFATWFPRFLQETRGVSLAGAGILTAFPLLAVMLGSPTGGLIVDRIFNRTGSKRLSRQGVAVPAMLGSAACIIFAYFIEDVMQAVGLITLGSFFAGLGGSCGYTVTIDKAGNHVAPVFGAMNMAGNLGAAICPFVVALIAERTGNWNTVLIFFAAVYVGAAACWASLNPEGTIDES
ncbi:MAG: MFS transporter [Planctomycetaceae bacterium]|nr:MFS transporter [Planctomycetaceae bacterium]